jgi:hypothetical protein
MLSKGSEGRGTVEATASTVRNYDISDSISNDGMFLSLLCSMSDTLMNSPIPTSR